MNAGTYGELLKNGGFHSFLWTQFLEALNDNIYKMLPDKDLSRANGLLEITTFVGIGWAAWLPACSAFSRRSIL